MALPHLALDSPPLGYAFRFGSLRWIQGRRDARPCSNSRSYQSWLDFVVHDQATMERQFWARFCLAGWRLKLSVAFGFLYFDSDRIHFLLGFRDDTVVRGLQGLAARLLPFPDRTRFVTIDRPPFLVTVQGRMLSFFVFRSFLNSYIYKRPKFVFFHWGTNLFPNEKVITLSCRVISPIQLQTNTVPHLVMLTDPLFSS